MEANYSTQSRRTATIIIFLVLLLHLLFLAFLLMMQHHNEAYELKLQQMREQARQMMQKAQAQTPQDETFEWFSGDARPSPAPVVFHEEPAAPDAKELSQPLEAATETNDQPEMKQEEKKEETVQETSAQEAEPAQEHTIEESEMKTTLMPDSPAKKEESETEHTKKIEKTSESKQNTQQNKTQPEQKSRKQHAQPQKRLSLADIAQGLMNKFDENSQHYVSSKGTNKGAPTDEQLKYERYIGKLFACMQKSIRIHKHKFNMDSFQEAAVYFQLSLQKNGNIEDVHIISSSGNRALDEFILFVVRDAGSAFPPVPSYLKQTSYPLGFIINPSSDRAGINFAF